MKTTCTADARTVKTPSNANVHEVKMASGTAMADAKCSPIRRAVKEVPVAVGADVQTMKTPYSTVVGTEDWFRMTYHGCHELGIPRFVGGMSTKMLECAHVKEAGHLGLTQLRRHY